MLTQLETRRGFEFRLMFFFGATALLLGILAAHILHLQFLGILAAHILHLQWIEHHKLAQQADRNRINVLPVLPVRGEIIDSKGRELAVNKIAYQVIMIPERVEQLDETLQQLAVAMQWSPGKLEQVRLRIRQSRPDRPVLLDDKLKWDVVAPIAARLHHLSGVDVQVGTYRFYPYADVMSHLIGYLSLARGDDVQAGYLSTEFIGRTGIEKSFESSLHGELGSQQEEVDVHGRRISVLKSDAPVMGEQLQLTINAKVQQAAAAALGNRTGAVVVMDVHSGAVIALLSRPGYDTNQFITGLEMEQWQTWLNDARKPLLNRATQAAYPPASTFKIITALAGLRQHAQLTAGTTTCEGSIELADRKLRCWKRTGHDKIDLHRALVESCDVYFYELGDQLGMGVISDEAERWGLGLKTGIALSPESRGLIPTHNPNMMDAIRHVGNWQRMKWFRGETMITAIGQGAVTVTPLQMARFAAAIANGGDILRPQLNISSEPVVQSRVDVDALQLQRVRDAMFDVVNSPHGTAYWPMRGLPWQAAGKTGTAQVIAMSQDDEKAVAPEYDRHKDHAWFMGYAPFENPQIAFAVFVEHGGHGGSAAAPVAAAIVRAAEAESKLDAGIELAAGPQP